MADADRLAALSPAKRQLLAQRLKERAAERLAGRDAAAGVDGAAGVGGAAGAAGAAGVGGEAGGAGPIARVPRGGPLPASAGQRQLWLIEQLAPGGAAYHIAAAWSLSGRLDPAALAGALAALASRHEVLRTRLAARDGEPLQEILPRVDLPLPLVDLSDLADLSAAEMVEMAEIRRPFDLARAPLLRALLIRLSPTEHRLLLTLHHAAADGWSMGILFREMAELYAAAAGGRTPSLAELPVQYADFAADQARRLASRRADLLAAWRRRLLPEAPRLDLPADRPRPLRPSERGGVRQRAVPAPLSAALDALARAAEATPFMALAAALAALLGRLAGQDEVSLGTPVAGRDRPELEGVVGYFVNTLVLRIDLAERPEGAVPLTFRALLGRVRERAVEAWEGAELPFEELVSALRPERRGDEPPFFQVLLTLQNAAGDLPAVALPGLRIAPAPLPGERGAKLDLSLSLAPAAEGGLAAVAVYRRDLFDAPTIDRLLGHYTALLAAAVAAPDAPLAALPILAPAERHALLHEWNDTAVRVPDVRVHELFGERAAADGAAPAVVRTGEVLASYRALERLSQALAARLVRAGVGPEVPVGLLARPSVRSAAAVLAILRAGGAVLPLDPAHPPARLAYLLADSGAPVVLVERALRPQLPLLPAPAPALLDLDEEPLEEPPGAEPTAQPAAAAGTSRQAALPAGPAIAGPGGAASAQPPPMAGPAAADAGAAPSPQEPPAAGSAPAHRPFPEQAAYLVYTSGSTGMPKGSVISHRALAAYMLWVRDASPYAGRPQPHAASLAFDASYKQLLGPLVAGAPVWLLRHGPGEPRELLAEIAAEPRGGLNCVPSLWRALLEEVERGAPGPAALYLGGEGFEPELVTRTLAALPAAEVWNLYGPTEGTANTTVGRVVEGDEGVGRPIANVRVHVLDRALGLQPPGAVGELAVGGVGLARGYLGRPALTAEHFVPDPFAERPGERLYLTGDRGRLRPDGRLVVLGREDGQVKVRGVRVELGEVEAAIAASTGVAACAVVAERRGQEVRLVAWIVLRGADVPEVAECAAPEMAEHAVPEVTQRVAPETPERIASDAAQHVVVEAARHAAIETVRRAVAERLPAAALPARFAALPELPRTATGKIDRRALARLDPGGDDGGEGGGEAVHAAPRTAVEERLAALWRETLGVARVGVHDSFFALGGDSIQSIRIAARAREAGLPLNARDLLERPTVAELAAALEAAAPPVAAAAPAVAVAPAADAPQPVPASAASAPPPLGYNPPGPPGLQGPPEPRGPSGAPVPPTSPTSPISPISPTSPPPPISPTSRISSISPAVAAPRAPEVSERDLAALLEQLAGTGSDPG